VKRGRADAAGAGAKGVGHIEAFEQGGGVVAEAIGKGGGSKLEHRRGSVLGSDGVVTK
jgi:hypothetical protein